MRLRGDKRRTTSSKPTKLPPKQRITFEKQTIAINIQFNDDLQQFLLTSSSNLMSDNLLNAIVLNFFHFAIKLKIKLMLLVDKNTEDF